jgi:rhodanese-related sulfurtransferase
VLFCAIDCAGPFAILMLSDPEPAEAIMEVDCRSVKERLNSHNSFLLLDCREQSEWDVVRIDGATLIPMSELERRLAELEPHRDQEIVVYCHHGVRSLRVAGWLRQQGFSDAVSMAGGIDVWAQDVDPTLPRY